jgi:hypothetical protein
MYLPRFLGTKIESGDEDTILRLNQYCSLGATLMAASDCKLCKSRHLEER